MLNSKKIVLLGHFGVGKTSLIRRFVHQSFSEEYKVSIGVHISKKEVQLPDLEKVSLIIWDLEGMDDLKKIRTSYLLGTHGILFVFDVNRPNTYLNINKNLVFLKDLYPNTLIKVIGNKADLLEEKKVKSTLKAAKINYDFLTSAKTGFQVEQAFLEITMLAN